MKFRVWNKILNKFDEDVAITQDGSILTYEWHNDYSKSWGGIYSREEENYVVQRFTDLKDHKNNEIYEGDIIDLTYSVGHERDSSQDYYGKYRVEFKNGEWKLIKIEIFDEDDYNNELSLWLEASDYQKKMGMESFEIIGNIFQQKT